jgi:Family of unknown function (DUF5320)
LNVNSKQEEINMPRQDKTGPLGQGPLTGRGLGPCGRGLGMRRGFGRGMGWRCWSPVLTEPVSLTKSEERKILEAELREVELENQEIQKRLKELS